MNTTNLLHNFQQIGVRFEPDGQGFRVLAPPGVVTLEMRELLKDHKTEIVNLLQQTNGEDSEIVWRIEAMRLQMAECNSPLPTLFAKQDINPKLGDCFSCGERLKEFDAGYCCGLCSRAKSILLEVV